MPTEPIDATDSSTADESPVEVLFLTGQPGAGKTAVAKELSELLWRSREPHAVIDLDELCRGFFPLQTSGYNRSLAIANLKAVWENFQAAGVRRVILARIIESLDDIQAFGGAIPNAHITVCSLTASPEMIQQRLTEREPGSARPFLLNVTTQIAERIGSLDLPGIRVDNSERSVNEVARHIIQQLNWPSLPFR
jgi:adenylylsulfate kinase-like enzyme